MPSSRTSVLNVLTWRLYKHVVGCIKHYGSNPWERHTLSWTLLTKPNAYITLLQQC